jgi:hypothetical protein
VPNYQTKRHNIPSKHGKPMNDDLEFIETNEFAVEPMESMTMEAH